MFFNDRMVAAMITIGDVGRINLYQLAKRSHTNRTYVGNLAKRMESLGLVTMEKVKDRRPVFVEPTEKGHRVAMMLKDSSKRIWDEITVENGQKTEKQAKEFTVDLSPRSSLVIGPGIDGYSLRVTTPDGSFTFNADMSKTKLLELQRAIESALGNDYKGSKKPKSRSKLKTLT